MTRHLILSTIVSLVTSSSACVDTSLPDLSGSVSVDHPEVTARPDPNCHAYDDPCDDHNHCTVDDRCTETLHCVGDPLSCDDGQACTAERCHPATGDCEVDDSACSCEDDFDCDDGEACTTDVCATRRCHNDWVDDACEVPD